MTRKIVYVTGTRADFGLLERTLRRADTDPRLSIQVCVTGMHLLESFGRTIEEIENSGLEIVAKVPVDLTGADGATMARALGQALIGMTDVFSDHRPDLVLVLGDRGEMLAGALAAIHLNIPVAHLHGGERSGTVDEPVRHAISKIAHYHMVTTPSARERLIKMGECAENIFVTGAPGLDGLRELVTYSRDELCRQVNLDASEPVALVLFHPVLQEADAAGEQIEQLLAATQERGMQALCLMPNSDAGSMHIRKVLENKEASATIRLVTHLPRAVYVSWLAAVDLLIGNSSSGIIEAATLGLPVVNIGSRQIARERSDNVIDCEPDAHSIAAAIKRGRSLAGREFENVYGDGRAGERIVELLATLPLGPELMRKINAY